MNSSVGKPNIKREAFQKDSLRTDFNKQLQFELAKLRQLIINGGGTYTLPIASDTILGGIKVGTNLNIDVDGVLSATGGLQSVSYLELTDTSDVSYVGKQSYIPMVNPAETGLILTESVLATFLLLSDTPDIYTGQATKVVSVKADETGLEFTTASAGVTPTDGILDWDAGTSKYQPYSAKKGVDPGYPYFYTGAVSPNYTTRLNLDGDFHASHVEVSVTSGHAIYGIATSGIGIEGYASSGTAVSGASASGTGVYGGGLLGVHSLSQNSSTNTLIESLKVTRQTTGTADVGIGGYISHHLEISNGTVTEASRFATKYTNVTAGTEESVYEWWLKKSGTLAKRMDLTPTGLNITTVTEAPILSAEMNTSPATWTIGANWTNNGNGSYTAAAGSGLLSTTVAVVSTRRYLISWSGLAALQTISLGSVTITKAAQTVNYIADMTANTTGNVTVSFQFGPSYTGTISNISIKELTPITSRVAAQFLHTTSTGIGTEIRSNLISHSIGVGLNSLGYLHTDGSGFGLYNTAFGELSCANLTSANYATAMGYMSLNALTTGEFNTAIGYRAGSSLTIGNNNVFIGYDAGRLAVSSVRNVAIGSNAGSSLTSGNCVFIGFQAGNRCTTGTNIGIGDQALSGVITSGNNTAVGTSAMLNATGQGNSVFGASVGQNLSTGEYNSFYGYIAGYTISTGSYNSFLGPQTGSTNYLTVDRLQQTLASSSDSQNVFLGYGATKQKLNTVVTNSVAIGTHSRVYQDNQVSLGNTEITSTYLRGDTEIRNHQVLAANSLSEGNFATHTKWTESGDFAYNGTKFTYTHNTGAGSLEQTTANFATPIKPNTWYRLGVTINYISSTGSLTRTGFINASLNGTSIELNFSNISGGSVLRYLYYKTGASTGNFKIDFTTVGTGTLVLDVTFAGLQEVIGGDLYVNRHIETIRGNYHYHSQLQGVDTAGDWRTYSDAAGFYTEYCTVGNQTKGQGTWVNKHTITI